MIYSFDSKRVFKPMILDQMARLADGGGTTIIEMLDENGITAYYIETGPTGAIFGSARGRPTNY